MCQTTGRYFDINQIPEILVLNCNQSETAELRFRSACTESPLLGFAKKAGFLLAGNREAGVFGVAPLIFQEGDDAVLGGGSAGVVAHDFADVGDGHQLVGVARAARLAGEGLLVEGNSAVVVAFCGVILRGLEEARGLVRVGGNQLLHDAVGGLRIEARERDVGAVDADHEGARVRKPARLREVTLRLVGAVVGEQIVNQVEVRQADRRVGRDDFAPEFDSLRVIVQVPVPCNMAGRAVQNPLAVLLTRHRADCVLRVAGRLLRAGVHAVPVQVGDKAGGALLILRVIELRLQKILVFPEQILRQILVDVEAVFDAVQALVVTQIEKVVDADAKCLRQQRKQRDIRHRGSIFPLGDGLPADAELLGELLLREAGLAAKLSDFLS